MTVNKKHMANQISFLAASNGDIDPIANAIFLAMNKISDLASRSVVIFVQNQTDLPLTYDTEDVSHGYLAVVNGDDDAHGTKHAPNPINPLNSEEKADDTNTEIIEGDTLVYKSHKNSAKGTAGDVKYTIEGNTSYFEDDSATKVAGKGKIYGEICINWNKPGGKGSTTFKATYTPLDTQNCDVGLYIRLTAQDVGASPSDDITAEPSPQSGGTITTEITNAGGHDNNLIVEIIPVSTDYLKAI